MKRMKCVSAVTSAVKKKINTKTILIFTQYSIIEENLEFRKIQVFLKDIIEANYEENALR